MCRNVRSIEWHHKTHHEISWDYPFKGIVSWDFGILFLISFDRCEVRNSVGSGLFFIFGRFHIWFFFKVDIPGKGIVIVPRFFVPNCYKLRRKSADFHSSDTFCIPNCCELRGRSADFHSYVCFMPNCCKLRGKSADFHSSDAGCIHIHRWVYSKLL
jgi:hypothetical protein